MSSLNNPQPTWSSSSLYPQPPQQPPAQTIPTGDGSHLLNSMGGLPGAAGVAGAAAGQRGLPNPSLSASVNSFQRTVTPTSLSQTPFPPAMSSSLPQPPQQSSPNRNIFSVSQQAQPLQQQRGLINVTQTQIGAHLKRPLHLASSASNLLGGTTTTGPSSVIGFGRSHTNDLNQPSLDLSEFPTLGTAGSNPSNTSMSSSRTYGMVSKPSQEQTPGFQILQEDFPALPGAPSMSGSEARKGSASPSGNSISSLYAGEGGSGAVAPGRGDPSKFPNDKATGQRKGIQLADGVVSNIPNGMLTDQFGMIGLLTFIRAAETDPNLVALAPGIDLTTLGLNLNSPDNLYSTFQSPWADSPCRPQDIDFHVPSEYLTNIFIRDKLAPIKLNRYTEDLLFYLFYMNGGDILQIAAAAELYSRDWRYHKEERQWLTRVQNMDPMIKTNAYERGTYYFFDPHNWRKVPKEFRLDYEKLEDRPVLPHALHYNPNQPPVAAH